LYRVLDPASQIVQEVVMLSRTGVGLLDIGILVGLLIPLVAVTFVTGRHLHSGTTIAVFAVLIAAVGVTVAVLLRAVRAAGWT
jgi:hypothetical protein